MSENSATVLLMSQYQKKLVIIDGNALVHRAFHALPPTMTSPKGVITNAVYGFTSLLIGMIKQLKPDYIAATFDLAGPTIRHEAFEDYKAHREKGAQELYDQFPLVKDVLRSFGIPIFEKEGYEADDVIGTIATKMSEEKGLQVVIVTGDLDTLQLVRDTKVIIYTLKKGMNDTITYDEKAVRERYGFSRNNLIDYRGLKGDPSDNIPGVHGVGEKTAMQLISQFHTLENLYEQLEENEEVTGVSLKLREKLLAGKQQAFLSKQLSTIYTDLDVDINIAKCDWRADFKIVNVEAIFRELGFLTLLKRIAEIVGTEDVSSQSGTATVEAPAAKNLQNPSNLAAFLQDVRVAQSLWLVSWDGLVILQAESSKQVFGLSFENAQLPKNIKDVLEDSAIKKYGHGLKFIARALNDFDGTVMAGFYYDTEIAAYVLNSEQRDYSLQALAVEYNIEVPKSAESAIACSRLLRQSFDSTFGQHEGQRFIFEKVEMPLIRVLFAMERNGILIDSTKISDLLERVNAELAQLEKAIYEKAGEEFNINSPQQLGVILYDKLALTGKIKKTSGGARSTAAAELEKLREQHPIIEEILKYREFQKLKSTYIEPFPTFIKADGRIHTTYSQTVAATGRLSSLDPNLQNIPTRTELGQVFKQVFIAPEGYQIVAMDYSQLELRLAAHLSGDPRMIEAFRNGEDIHTRTAAFVYGVPPEQVTKDQRRNAKTLNFGVLYGMGPVAFAAQSGLSRSEASDFIEKYFLEFDKLADYIEKIKQFARDNGYTETFFGRRRLARDIFATMPMLRAQAERMAVNHPIQGTEADLIKLAMIKIDSFMIAEVSPDDAKMLLQVHDELVFEIKTEKVPELVPKIKHIMESVHQFNVPITVEPKSAQNWGEVEVK